MKWNDIPLRFKIPCMIVGFAMVVGVGVAVSSNITASNRVDSLTQDRLAGVAKSRSEAFCTSLMAARLDVMYAVISW